MKIRLWDKKIFNAGTTEKSFNVRLIALGIVSILFFSFFIGQLSPRRAEAVVQVNSSPAPGSLIRFHVIANSDSDKDQALKRAVRDAVLREVSPQVAESRSLDESRQILKKIMPQMEGIGRSVVKEWGKDYEIKVEYGRFLFPTKSYGSLVLPAGDYEAVRILIGKAEGANWWCVLFPPLCFVDIENSTALPVDGKPGIPIQENTDQESYERSDKGNEESQQNSYENNGARFGNTYENHVDISYENDDSSNQADALNETGEEKKKEKSVPVVKFWFWEKAKEILGS